MGKLLLSTTELYLQYFKTVSFSHLKREATKIIEESVVNINICHIDQYRVILESYFHSNTIVLIFTQINPCIYEQIKYQLNYLFSL